jgi:hypothetical protein
MVGKAHGGNGFGGVTAAHEVGKTLAMRHRDRQARTRHALEEQAR